MPILCRSVIQSINKNALGDYCCRGAEASKASSASEASKSSAAAEASKASPSTEASEAVFLFLGLLVSLFFVVF